VDERKLEELFRDAVTTAPPATFDEQDVIRGSRRVTARRRLAAVGGSLVVTTLLVGGIGVGTGVFRDESNTIASQPESAKDRPGAQTMTPRSGDDATRPPMSVEPGGAGQCGSPDSRLAGALAGQLPEVRATSPVAASGGCPSGSQSVAFVLRDGDAAGRLSVILSPVGTTPPDQARPQETRRPDGTEQVTRKAHSGRILMVLSDPDAGSPAPPFRDRLVPITEGLAGQL
jgi:hypothetical protein